MSRKRKAPKKILVVDPKYKSVIIPKLINSIMYDGKKISAEKIVYEAIEKIRTKSKDEPISVFNDAINNVRPFFKKTRMVKLFLEYVYCYSLSLIKCHMVTYLSQAFCKVGFSLRILTASSPIISCSS